MSGGAVLLLALCACAIGVVVGYLIRSRRAAVELDRLRGALHKDLREAQTSLEAANAGADEARRALAASDKQRTDEVEQRKLAEAAQHAAAAARQELQRELAVAEELLAAQQRRCEELARDVESAAQPVDTLTALKNDPAIGPGQFETLRLMYEQFSAAPVLKKK